MTSKAPQIAPQSQISEFRRFRKVFLGRIVVVIGLVIISCLVLTALFAPLIAPYDPYKTDILNTLASPSLEHPFGTDAVGRDIFSRVVYGTRTSLIVGLISVSLAAFFGMTLGLVAGYFGGWVNTIVMRFTDTLLSFPMIILALVISALLGGGLKNVIIALTVGLTPVYARLMCGQVLSAKENDYILAEQAMGAKSTRIMLKHLVPNCFPPLIVLITMMLGSTILAEAGLSFLGVGIEPPTAAWGSMVNDGREYLLTNPILTAAPGVAIMLTVFGFNMVGDGLRDALDPRLRDMI